MHPLAAQPVPRRTCVCVVCASVGPPRFGLRSICSRECATLWRSQLELSGTSVHAVVALPSRWQPVLADRLWLRDAIIQAEATEWSGRGDPWAENWIRPSIEDLVPTENAKTLREFPGEVVAIRMGGEASLYPCDRYIDQIAPINFDQKIVVSY